MPYNATWIEPWMRPVKQIPRSRSRRTRKVVFRELNRDKLEPILENRQENRQNSMNQGSNQTSSETKKRRATRLRRISSSNNWSGKLKLDKSKPNGSTSKKKNPKSKKNKSKSKPNLTSTPLGTKI
jgi:hypothetical protein